MSYECTSSVVVGFVTVIEDFLRPLAKDDSETWVFEGKEFDDQFELLEAIGEHVKAQISEHGNFCLGVEWMAIQPKTLKHQEDERYTFQQVEGAFSEAYRIGEELKKLGLTEIGNIGIHSVWDYS